MSLIGKIVKHKLWGSGTIDSIVDRHITVSFSKPIGEKVFAYPQAFESFLSFEGEMPSEMSAALAAEKPSKLLRLVPAFLVTAAKVVPQKKGRLSNLKSFPAFQVLRISASITSVPFSPKYPT